METPKRFDFSKMTSQLSQMECEDFVGEYKLEDRMREENFLFPELTHLQVFQQVLEADALQGVISDQQLAALGQRVIWLVEEVKSLRRTNRNIRSKNLRLKRGKEQQPKPLPVHCPTFYPTAEEKQLLLRTKHLDRADGRLPGGGYQPLPDPNAVYDANGKCIPQNPPRGR